MKRMRCKKYPYRMVIGICGIFALSLFSGCISEMVDPQPVAMDVHTGYTVQLTSPFKNVHWECDNPSVATVSSTGLVTALQKGAATISTSANGRRYVACYLTVYPKRNILFYIGGDNNLSGEACEKINVIRAGWRPDKGEMIIYVDRHEDGAALLRVNSRKGDSGRYGLDTIAVYGNENSAASSTLARVIKTLKQDFPADHYGMIFFSHASGWLPEGTLNRPRSMVIDQDGQTGNREMEYDDFASAIPDRQFDFIILEACLMADVVSMYELRNKAGYILASSAEIVSPGFTYIYRDEIMRLYDTKNDVRTVVAGFGQSCYRFITTQFAENDVSCSFTISLIKADEMERLAAATKTALQGADPDATTVPVDRMQRFDRPNKLINTGYNRRSRYFDFARMMEEIASEAHYATFCEQLDRTVVWKAQTKRFLLGGSDQAPYFDEYDGFFIRRHSGLTTYIKQRDYPALNAAFENSSWYRVTRPAGKGGGE
jgi:hypothetical protein